MAVAFELQVHLLAGGATDVLCLGDIVFAKGKRSHIHIDKYTPRTSKHTVLGPFCS